MGKKDMCTMLLLDQIRHGGSEDHIYFRGQRLAFSKKFLLLLLKIVFLSADLYEMWHSASIVKKVLD